jgi:hypothetical protein
MPYSGRISTETGFHFAQSKQINRIFPTVEMVLVVQVTGFGGIMPVFADILPGVERGTGVSRKGAKTQGRQVGRG